MVGRHCPLAWIPTHCFTLYLYLAWLQGCVFTNNVNEAIRISDAMETGTVQVNGPPARGPDHFPFQGFKDSGIGSQGIKNSISIMVKDKSTVINLNTKTYTMG